MQVCGAKSLIHIHVVIQSTKIRHDVFFYFYFYTCIGNIYTTLNGLYDCLEVQQVIFK